MGWFSSDENITITLNESTVLVVALGAVLVLYCSLKYALKFHRLKTVEQIRVMDRLNQP